MLPRSISQRYRRLAETVGLRSTRLHALRHFSASQLVTAGVDLRTVAGRLGHGSGGATTLRTYAAWSTEADRRAASTIAGIVPVPDPSKREPRAAYEVLAARLIADIESGKLKPGTQLPTLVQLAAEHNLAPNTAHRAVVILRDRGLVQPLLDGELFSGRAGRHVAEDQRVGQDAWLDRKLVLQLGLEAALVGLHARARVMRDHGHDALVDAQVP
jgi:hypothetical protein